MRPINDNFEAQPNLLSFDLPESSSEQLVLDPVQGILT